MHHRPTRSLWFAGIFAAAAIFVTGCKTSEDATALANQFSTTSKALSGYYVALDKELQATDELNVLGEGLNGTRYAEDAQDKIRNATTAIEERQTVADTLGQVAGSFGKLSGSTAAADAASSAGKLEDAAEGLKLLPSTLNSAEKSALAGALQGLVKLIQQRKERQAAKKMADVVSMLAILFASEQNAYNSINDQYADLSRSFAQVLARDRQIDTSAFEASLTASALAPYSLTPELSNDVKLRLDKEIPNEISRESVNLKTSHQKASDGMETSLRELAKALATLAADKPLATSGPGAALGDVNQWVSSILGK